MHRTAAPTRKLALFTKWRSVVCGFLAVLTCFAFGTNVLADDPTASPSEADKGIRRVYGEVFAEHSGVKLRADVYLPTTNERVPAVLMIHGGGWMSGTRWNMMMHANQLVRAGYAVVNIDYRLAPAHPHPAQIEDCRAAWCWMCDNADRFHFDTERLAVYGYSAGGHLACLLGLAPLPGANPKLRPRAIVAGGAVCDFDWLPENSQALAYFLGGSRRERAETYRDAAPISYVSRDDPPVFLFHGDDDLMVPLSSPRRMLDALKMAGVTCELQVRPQAGHIATFFDPEPPQQAIAFLARELHTADKSQPGSTQPGSTQPDPAGPAPPRAAATDGLTEPIPPRASAK